MSGNKTISNSETKIEALQLQSSAYGIAVPVVYGVTRIPGNLLWYGGFKAIPHTSTTDGGGKGGGVKTQQTNYTYEAALMMALCEGEITGVASVWRGKMRYQGGILPSQIVNANETYAIPANGGVYTVAHAAAYAGEIAVTTLTGGGESGGEPWNLGEYGYTRVGGTYSFDNEYLFGRTVSISYQYTAPSAAQTSLQQLGLSLARGNIGQATWSYLSTNAPTQAIGYSGLSYVFCGAYDLGAGATVDNHTFEIQAKFAYSIDSATPDADPARCAYDLLLNTRYGANFPSIRLGDMALWSSYCRSVGILISPALTEQQPAAELITSFCQLTNTAPIWSEGQLKFIPYGDAACSGNGAEYMPDTTPIYDLTDDHFLGKNDPVKINRKPQADCWNQVQIEYRNRANQYNLEIVEAKDEANIGIFGLRAAPIFRAHWICETSIARIVAQLILQRSLYIRATYEFSLPWNFSLLEPMDLITLTDAGIGLNKLPVRIISSEEAEDGELSFIAEDYPLGVASTTLYPSQDSNGFLHNYNISPGDVSQVIIFEAPAERTLTGLEIYIALNSENAGWGGANIWVSTDGNNYKRVSKVYGGARCGTLSGLVTGEVLPVTIGPTKQLISGSATDAQELATLCYLGGASPEYVSYTTATLNAPGAYSLTLTTRGAYGTEISAHAANDAFVRIDDAIGKSGPLDLSMIGKTIYFKFTSFNIYGGAEQTLADVSAMTYIITGIMAKLPPPDLTGLTVSILPDGTRRAEVTMGAEPGDSDGVELRYSLSATTNFDAMILWGRIPKGARSFESSLPAEGTYWIAATMRDQLGNRSKNPVFLNAIPLSKHPGAVGSISTGQIAPSAATDVLTFILNAPVNNLYPESEPNPIFTTILQGAYAATVSGPITLRATVSGAAVTSSVYPFDDLACGLIVRDDAPLGALFTFSSSGYWDEINSRWVDTSDPHLIMIHGPYEIAFVNAANTASIGNGALQLRFDAVAGKTYYFAIGATHFRQELVSTNISAAEMTLEAMKR